MLWSHISHNMYNSACDWQGWALDKDGHETDSPEAALPSGGGCGLPLGGGEVTSGYKGYGLGLMVEIFCGILSGSGKYEWLLDTILISDWLTQYNTNLWLVDTIQY